MKLAAAGVEPTPHSCYNIVTVYANTGGFWLRQLSVSFNLHYIFEITVSDIAFALKVGQSHTFFLFWHKNPPAASLSNVKTKQMIKLLN